MQTHGRAMGTAYEPSVHPEKELASLLYGKATKNNFPAPRGAGWQLLGLGGVATQSGVGLSSSQYLPRQRDPVARTVHVVQPCQILGHAPQL